MVVAPAAAAIIMLTALVDAVTGVNVTFGVFYVVPVVAVTILVGTAAGTLTAVTCASAWVLADGTRGAPSPSLAVHIANGFMRSSILIAIVALVTALRRAVAQATASEQRGREFLAFAAHQLRTPVAGVRSAADALLATGASPAQERLLRHISEESARSGRLVTSLLRVARLDQGEALERRPCDLSAILAEEVARLRERAPHLTIDLHVAPSVPSRPPLSGQLVQEAIGNVLDNAVRHADATIRVAASAADGMLHVAVHDDGGGLPAGTEVHAFERFVSLDGAGGSGLGLPIAVGIAELHGGSLAFEDGEFVLRLPLTDADRGVSSRDR